MENWLEMTLQLLILFIAQTEFRENDNWFGGILAQGRRNSE